MASGITPLSLAYLIEISFVVNLAYHELNTFNFRDSLRKKINEVLSPYKKMWDGNETLVEPEWGYLKNFYTGEDKAAWENKKRRYIYHWFIYSGWDRQIIRFLLVLDVIILVVCTLCSNLNVSPIYTTGDLPWHSLPSNTLLWWGGFGILTLSLIIPFIFMVNMRCCHIYVHGCAKDQYNDGNGGRVHNLSQEVLKKTNASNTQMEISLNKLK